MKNLILGHFKKTISIMIIAILLLSTISFEVFAADPKVSIIIPVYNTPENLLRDSLESAKNQTLKDIEIICVDDGSTNGSEKILDEYAKSDPRFKIVHQKNGGCSVARNKGLDIAKGEYIQFLDSDDTINPTMSEKCYNKAKEHNADIVKCGYTAEWNWAEFSIEDKVTVGPAFHFEGQGFIWNGIWKRIFSKGDKLYSFVDSKRRGDEVLNLTFMPKANKIIYFSEKLYHYTKENSNSITNVFEKMHNDELECISKNIECIYKNWKNNGYFSDNIAKIDFLKFILRCDKTSQHLNSIKSKYNLLLAGVGSELLQVDVINQLPLKERIEFKVMMQQANCK